MDPLVIHVQLGSKVVSRVLVDSGSSSDILYWDAFQKLGFEQNNLRPTTCTLVGFGGERVKALGVITLEMVLGEDDGAKRKESIDFIVVSLTDGGR